MVPQALSYPHTPLFAVTQSRPTVRKSRNRNILVPLAKGEKLGAFGLTEPGAGTDAQGQQTKAVLDGDEWVLNGSKIFITNGKEADVYVIIAVTGIVEEARGRREKKSLHLS